MNKIISCRNVDGDKFSAPASVLSKLLDCFFQLVFVFVVEAHARRKRSEKRYCASNVHTVILRSQVYKPSPEIPVFKRKQFPNHTKRTAQLRTSPLLVRAPQIGGIGAEIEGITNGTGKVYYTQITALGTGAETAGTNT